MSRSVFLLHPCGKSLSLLCLIALLFACWETTLGLASTPSIGSHNPENVSPELDSSKHTEVGASDLPVLVFQTSRSMVCLTTQVIQPPQAHRPPASTLVVTPTATGTYPVILFKHGFSIPNCFYIQLLKMLASSGYIIVAPQYFTFDTDSTSEVEETAKMAIWIRDSLQQVLHAVKADGSIIIPNAASLIMAGHSRGGKIAFAMALGKASSTKDDPIKFSALVTLDPVDGPSSSSISKPQMVRDGCNHDLNHLAIPALIFGSGYGEKGVMPCAPSCCSHRGYFNCSSSPLMYHLSAVEYGHMDFLDDSSVATDIVCPSGNMARKQLRQFTVRLVLAFLRATLEGSFDEMEYIVDNWENIDSVKLTEPEIYRAGDVSLQPSKSSGHGHDEL
ncbi:hypothetical protein KP509_1Z048200 [Ceratopteris richardii]|nr:hypothetical protein KP509_1Z048100 [Ceratopteris richardii]KAH6558742.1 hypothetical protein KP509_1Z048200 [Ceratopteris richardii]